MKDFYSTTLKKIILKILPKGLLNFLTYGPFDYRFVIKSYSQEGEDMILRSVFASYGSEYRGFYVDIGAHHPKMLSNTFYFYQRGWRGINVDPIPDMKSLFDEVRSEDINLNIGISSKAGKLNYYIFDKPAVNTLNEHIARELNEEEKHKCKLIKTIPVEVDTLENVLDNYLGDRTIDFMSIDVEGYEIEVLQSNNWQKYRPKIICLEMHGLELDKLTENNLHIYLKNLGYKIFAKTGISVFYKDLEN